MRRALLAVVVALAVGGPAGAACPDRSALKNVYFGDLHSHSGYSLDAYGFGTRTDPATSYAFARGAAVDIAEGANLAAGQVRGPFGYRLDLGGATLDFAAVTDHSEWLSTDYGCTADPASPFYGSSYCTAIRNHVNPFFGAGPHPCNGFTDGTGTGCDPEQTTAWAAENDAAEAADEPCAFTTFHAYEWTASAGTLAAPQVLHKNVFFKNANVPSVPLDAFDFPTAPLLWDALAQTCNADTGCEAITVPHNMNQSIGRAFDTTGYTPVDLNRMLQFQRLVEVHQHKGSSECVTDTADTGAVAACDFEVVPAYADPQDAPGYARAGLESGLAGFAATGFDPLAFGLVGGTDNHDGTPGAAAETSFVGHLGASDNQPAQRLAGALQHFNPGGLTGVWAEENTRDAIWGALKRREVFATSGPRIAVRFYEYTGLADPCGDAGFPATVVAAGGVPMGGTMPSAAAPPSFVVFAVEDTTPLAAVDVVKASVVGGAVDERVRTIPFVGPPYCVTWTDPAFDPAAPAFYYARVREQPTWRWSHYDCLALQQTNPSGWQTIAPGCLSSDPSTGGLDYAIEERAWTSSIWYLPGGPVTLKTTFLEMLDPPAAPAERQFWFKTDTTHEGADHRVVLPRPGSDGDPTATGGAGGGAAVDVYNPDTGERAHVVLPASGWRLKGFGTAYAFRQRDGVVRRVIVRKDRVVIRAGGSGWPFTLDEARQGTLAVRLQLGTAVPWCSVVPAATTGLPPSPASNDMVGRFLGLPNAPAAEQCPLTS
jgi:hypothetical protein